MRAAHSLKGAARIVGLDVGVRVAHAMEDCFVAAQRGAADAAAGAHRPAAAGRRPAGAHRAHGGGGDRASGTSERRPRSTCCLAALRASAHDGRRDSAACERPRRAHHAQAARIEPATPAAGPERRRYPRARSKTPRSRPRAARLGREPESPAEPGGRVAGRVALGQAVRRVAAPAQAAAARARARRSRRCATRCRRDDDRRASPSNGARRGAAPSIDEAQQFLGAAAGRARDVRPALDRISRIGSTTRRWPAACGRSPTASRRLPRMVRDLGRVARQAGAARDRRRRDAGRPRHPRASSTRRSAICCATPSTTASSRRRSARPPASRPRA